MDFMQKRLPPSGPVSTFPYTALPVNSGCGFSNITANIYSCPQSGVYCFFITVVWDGLSYAEFAACDFGTTYPISRVVRRQTTYNNYDTNLRDAIMVIICYLG